MVTADWSHDDYKDFEPISLELIMTIIEPIHEIILRISIYHIAVVI